jgi:hypothetical protein
MHLLNRTRWAVVTALALVTLGCGDSNDPADGIAGTYQATEATLTVGGEDTDLLAEGAGITVTLSEAGTTSGTLTVPASLSESGAAESFSLAGTYSYDEEEGTVTFDHPADTFIRDVVWDVDGSEIQGAFTGTDGVIAVTLERQD